MEWEKLISTKTLVKREPLPSVWKHYPVNELAKDYKEIITSIGFRNLQNKAQVFSLAISGVVRTRLTHSLEGAAIAKQMGNMLADNAKKKTNESKCNRDMLKYTDKFGMILECAGLLHDLGNPAFGHFGEASMGNYFRKLFEDNNFTYKGKPVGSILDEQMKNDLIHFDGNAQTIHLLLKDTDITNMQRINVAYSVINTLVKYPGNSLAIDSDSKDIRRHKYGYYKADERLFNQVREDAGVSGISRYPLTYLLEAADDISYLLSDMQDSLSKAVITPEMIKEEFLHQISEMPQTGSEEYELRYMAAENVLKDLTRRIDSAVDTEGKMAAIDSWFDSISDWLVYAAVNSWYNNYDAIMDGTFTGELLEGTWHSIVIEMIRKLMKSKVYPSKVVLEQELSGHKMLENILKRFIPAVLYYDDNDEKYKPGHIEKHYLWYIPGYLKDEYMIRKTGNEAYDLYLRFIMIVDFVSALTDHEAKKLGELL